jgi:hypothetical protein
VLYRLFQFLVLVFQVATYPLRPLIWLIDKAEGWPRVREQGKEMQQRPPLTDEALAEQLGLSAREAAVWSVIRKSTAHHCVLPDTAVYPDDSLDTLFRLMRVDTWLVLDWSDVVFHVERELGVSLDELAWVRLEAAWEKPRQQFRHFAAVLAAELTAARDKAGTAIPPAT